MRPRIRPEGFGIGADVSSDEMNTLADQAAAALVSTKGQVDELASNVTVSGDIDFEGNFRVGSVLGPDGVTPLGLFIYRPTTTSSLSCLGAASIAGKLTAQDAEFNAQVRMRQQLTIDGAIVSAAPRVVTRWVPGCNALGVSDRACSDSDASLSFQIDWSATIRTSDSIVFTSFGLDTANDVDGTHSLVIAYDVTDALIDGATLTTVDVWRDPGKVYSRLPERMPRVKVVRQQGFFQSVNLHAGDVIIDPSATASEFMNRDSNGNWSRRSITAPCTQNNVIDKSTNRYQVWVYNCSGQYSQQGLTIEGITLTMSKTTLVQ